MNEMESCELLGIWNRGGAMVEIREDRTRSYIWRMRRFLANLETGHGTESVVLAAEAKSARVVPVSTNPKPTGSAVGFV
jgi:hypothetical protein